MHTARGPISVATDGHLCRLLLERHINDFLHHWGITHEAEPGYPPTPGSTPPDCQQTGGFPCHFVEELGFPDEPAYAAKVARKRQFAGVLSIPLITPTADDLMRLPVVFAPWLPTSAIPPQPRTD